MPANGFAVTFEDGRTETVYPRLGDTLQYSFVWKKRQWPSPQEDQILLSVFTAYAACRREGKFTGTFEDFQAQVVDFEEVDADGEPAPAPAPDESAPPVMPGFPAGDFPSPPTMTPQEPAPITASASTDSSSTLTTTPEAGSSRHSR